MTWATEVDELFGITSEILEKPVPIHPDSSIHDWSMSRESLFSGESFLFRCKRCFKYLTVKRDQTIDQALGDMGVDPNCGMGIVSDIMKE